MLRYLCLLLAALAATPFATAQRTLLHCGTLYDGTAAAPRPQMTLVVEAGRVTAVQTGYTTPQATDRVIDLKAQFVMPGVIDCHTHLTHENSRDQDVLRVKRPVVEQVLLATQYARTTLLAGVTTVRDLGAEGGMDLALRTAIQNGWVQGPRILAAGKSLAVLGGHADPTNSYREDIMGVPTETEGVTSGPESCRRAALLAIKRGADVIKITATAGVLSRSVYGSTPQFTEEEIRVIVQTARDFGLYVAAHCHGAEGIKRAARAGVRSIEHGSYLDDEALRIMKANGTWLVPTLTAGRAVTDSSRVPGFYPPAVAAKAARIGPELVGAVQRAWQAGVNIAFGTDAGVFQHGQNLLEFQYMGQAGIPPLQCLHMATGRAAEMLGRADVLGTLQPGRYADVIALPQDPTQNLAAMTTVRFVMKEGVVVKE